MEIYVCCDIMLLCALWVLTKSEYLIYALWELANHNSWKLDLIFNPRFPGVEFALHEMEVDGKKVNFFCLKWLCLASNDFFLPQMTWCMQTLLDEGHFTKSVRLHHHSELLDWQTTKFGTLLPFYFFLLVWRVERQRICDRLSHKSLWGPRYIRRPQKTATK